MKVKYFAVAAEYAELPLIPPYLQPGSHQFTYGANFASAGAGALVETSQGLVCEIILHEFFVYFYLITGEGGI